MYITFPSNSYFCLPCISFCTQTCTVVEASLYPSVHYVRRWFNQAGSRVTDASQYVFALEGRKSVTHHSVVKLYSPTAGGVGDIHSQYSTLG